ncbi:class I SAM-dependent methyltransferase [Ruegeria hyattellae]|uniref:class I SAM-dependent methyltransferase n=1 Tax=Ruegeria hyattellae TaxID=3233337 RepID=UPI00355C5FF3
MDFSDKSERLQFLKESEARCPIPNWDKERLARRRWVLKHAGTGGVGAEIGVFRGQFSALICEIAKPRALYLVDPWTTLGETFGWGKEYTSFDKLTTLSARQEAQARVADFPEVTCHMIEATYPACQDRLPDQLDWAYLDASHKYEPTLNELRHLDSHVTPDGVIMGDDWDPNPESAHYGVFLAVQQFVRESAWEIVAAGHGRQWVLRRRNP